MELGVDIYFGEFDRGLQAADQAGDDKGVVDSINHGLDSSTALLGLVTIRTAGSWWVPYEIGGATGRVLEVAYIIHRGVTELPEYIRVARVIADQAGLQNWCSQLLRNMGWNWDLTESPLTLPRSQALQAIVPRHRDVGELTFYPGDG